MSKARTRQTSSPEPVTPEKEPRMIQEDLLFPPSLNITSELRPDGDNSTILLTPPPASDSGSHSPEPNVGAEKPQFHLDNDPLVFESGSLAPSSTHVALLHSSFDTAYEAAQPIIYSNDDHTPGNVQEPIIRQTLAPSAVPAEIYDFLDDGPDTTVAQDATDHAADEDIDERDALFAHFAPDYETYSQSPQHSSAGEPREAAPQSTESPAQASASVPEVMEEEENMAVRVKLQPLNFEAVVGKPWREQQEDTERFLQDMMTELVQLTSDTRAWASLKVVQVDQSARDILYEHIDKIDQMEAADRKAIGQLAQFAQSVETALLQMQLLSSM